ncbi:MAG: SEC-C metal-binding domain-containing protein [Vulcanimicrobiota bacterium]
MKKKPLEIVVLQGGGRGARHPLVAPHVVLGRLDPMETAPAGSLLFPEPTVSRIHATLEWDEAARRYLLTHRSATNATLVNKARISKPRHIGPGDKIQMGNLIIEVRVGVGQHAELELATVDFTALTKKAADQVYRPETVMPEPPAMPAAGPQSPQEAPAPIPAPIPPPARRPLPQPVFNEPYAPIEVVAVPVVSRAELAVPKQFFEFPEADEMVSQVDQAPRRRIQLSSLPRQESPEVEETGLPGVYQSEGEPLVSEEAPVQAEAEPELVPPAQADPETEPENPEEISAGPAEPEETPAQPEKAAEAPAEKPKQKPIRREKPKIGRNQKCPCGSGKKYKKCCGQ